MEITGIQERFPARTLIFVYTKQTVDIIHHVIQYDRGQAMGSENMSFS